MIAHCDWSKDPKKRWMTVAIRHHDFWHLTKPELVGNTSDLFERLQMRTCSSGSMLVGFDFPIGLPVEYGRRTGFSHFRDALIAFGRGEWIDWFRVCEAADQISVHRPFYPMRPGGTSRTRLLEGLSLTAGQILRRCDKGTLERSAACSIFWTLGGNQVGKGAISGWQEILVPNIHDLKLWPFDGMLDELSRSASLIVVETYPGEVYHQLGLPRHGWSKRRQTGRQHVAPMLEDRIVRKGYRLEDGFSDLIRHGFTASPSGEDQFDALVGLLGMLDVVEDDRPDSFTMDRQTTEWEGWIFGQAASEG